MIVKNESATIEKCLASVKPLIDYWVIVDTGSTDQTQQIIQKYMKDIPGELHERPWVDFAHNRNEALALAKDKGDYLLLIDADEVLEYDKDFTFGTLAKDLYFILVRQLGTADVKRNGLINNHLHWQWKGVLHEVISSDEAKSFEVLQGIRNICNTHPEGASGRSKESKAIKHLRDAATLEKALQEEPENSRYAFYLGISYAGAGQFEKAKKAFEKRLEMVSYDHDEIYQTFYNLGLMQTKLGENEAAIRTFLSAHAFRPTRAEPLLRASILYSDMGNVLVAYLLAQYALAFPYPKDETCVEYVAYDYTIQVQHAYCALLLGKKEEAAAAYRKLLDNPNVPETFRPALQNNYETATRPAPKQVAAPSSKGEI
jgi:glycosyltransferase involved in cell wall biosynthesis